MEAVDATRLTTHISDLPRPLLAQVLRRLRPEGVLRFAAASRAANAAASADEIWQTFWGLGLSPAAATAAAAAASGLRRPPPLPPPGASWRAAYCAHRRALCAECGAPASYVFQLLNCRLCVDCERRNPTRYGLATETEARERWGVGPSDLAGLRHIDARRRRWYLRSAVEALAHARRRVARGVCGAGSESADCSSSGSGSGEDLSDESEGGSSCASGDEGCSGGKLQAATGSGLLAAEGGGGGGGSDGDGPSDLEAGMQALQLQQAQRGARREERKAAKKQAKAEQRAKRELKSHGLHWPGGGGAHGASRQQQAPQAPGGGSVGGRGGGRRVKQDGKKAKYQQQRDARDKHGPAPGRGGARVRSEWLAEREQMLREYGEDPSGLVFATD